MNKKYWLKCPAVSVELKKNENRKNSILLGYLGFLKKNCQFGPAVWPAIYTYIYVDICISIYIYMISMISM